MKLKVILFIISVTVIVLFYLVIRPIHSLEKENLENIQKVKIRMDSIQVLAIMGQPAERRYFKGEIYYDYEAPSGSSVQIQVILDTRGYVVYVSPVSLKNNDN